MPGTTGRFRCGGLLVELQSARLVAELVPTQVVTYRQREPDHPFLADLLRREPAPGPAQPRRRSVVPASRRPGRPGSP